MQYYIITCPCLKHFFFFLDASVYFDLLFFFHMVHLPVLVLSHLFEYVTNVSVEKLHIVAQICSSSQGLGGM